MPNNHPTTHFPVGKAAKPNKPYPEFPLTPHPNGRWCKKIRGKVHYFGTWGDPDGALNLYLSQKDDLHAGRTPRPDPDALTVKELANRFLAQKQAMADNGELASLTWMDYKTACDEIIAAFRKDRLVADLRPDDFTALRKQMGKKWGPHRLGKTIQFVRCVFKYAYDAELIDRPVRFGPGFKRPSKKVVRLHRAEQGPKLFTADEVRRMIADAGLPLKAMLLLGINCAFGNSDCGNLPLSAVDMETGMIDFPRPKTGIGRRCCLWPETIEAIQAAMEKKPSAKKEERAGLVFLTRCGDSWHTGTPDGPLSREVSKLLRRLGIGGRKRLGFYTLRHTFRTIADETKDQPAVDFVMGHEVPHMSAVYRETISDDRLRAVADHVRNWLFNETAAPKEPFAWSLPPQPIIRPGNGRKEFPETLPQDEQNLRRMYGLGKASYKQVLLAKRLMAKGWREPYYYRGYVWLSSPLQRKPSMRAGSNTLGKAIRITKAGRILRGW